ncbi:dTDP-4-dehydrorhamnose reductase [Halomonas urumqiensis]|uniref:dTDP-4-dehydrorhamnose reductase n=1 Tax=Halomonas urumqiensis TaxID=1684789 RepID=A0A2N7UCK4_9GAMM|nr:dTDP-4-dehydrorhamnose reductase [Halomonas urumqiensis]PMR78121.1 dTDP-4-dehydrorhamnose reductase [Halomonas urumqiensis]PTB03271.1 dTDP-4-dehydrorhamnose reductase [Halomonas urumqiensis]GHE20569.1 NAD(P)-dependent oxidoreductase [Halomonas urumqiensis]
MKILLTGGNGQVGFELQRQLCLLGTVLAPRRQELDLSNEKAVSHWLEQHRPELIVNAAAYTAVDKAESEPELARRLNAELPEQLAAYAAKQQCWLVHYSSDYVYPGTGSMPLREDDKTGPLSIYGQTKLEGDLAIAASGCLHLIFRTSWVYSARGNNFMKTMLRLGRERDSLKVVNDQIGVPTPARLIAQVTELALGRALFTSHTPSGIYHLAPAGETSWQGFACEIFRLAAAQAQRLAVTPERVEGIPTSQYPTPAQRPLNSRLVLNRLEHELKVTMPRWQDQLALTLAELIDLESR